MADDPRAEEKREQAVLVAVTLATLYASARAEIMGRVARGVRSGLLLDYWLDRVREANELALKRIAAATARGLSDRVSTPRMDGWLEAAAEGRAEGWFDNLDATLEAIDDLAEDFREQAQAIADEMVMTATDDAVDVAASAVEFGAIEAEKADGKTTKTWQLGPGDNHRASHVALNGVTIGINERFANGLRYPHAPGPPAETVNCNCFLTYGG